MCTEISPCLEARLGEREREKEEGRGEALPGDEFQAGEVRGPLLSYTVLRGGGGSGGDRGVITRVDR